MLKPAGRIFVYGRPVDMRNGLLGLLALVRRRLSREPLSGDLFVFLNKRGTILKALFWDRTGYMVVAKYLERATFKLRSSGTRLEIDQRNLRMLLDGLPAVGRKIEEHQDCVTPMAGPEARAVCEPLNV